MPLTCLIAAHDPWFLQLLRIYSEESGFHVVQVHQGQDVLPMVHQEHPAAVLMQADLPGKLKGREALRQMHNDPQAHHIPVLVFSWHSQEDDSDLPADWLDGAAAYLQEPITFEGFQDALTKAGVTPVDGPQSSAHTAVDQNDSLPPA